MDPDGLVPTLLMLGALPTIPVTNSNPTSQNLGIDVLNRARTKIPTIVPAQRIARPFASCLPLATRYLVSPGDRLTVYRERSYAWEGPLMVRRILGNQAWLEDSSNKVDHCSTVQVLPEPTGADDRMGHQKYMCSQPVRLVQHIVMLTENLHPCDPRPHYPSFSVPERTHSTGLLHGTCSSSYHGTQCRQMRKFFQDCLFSP